MDNHDTHFITKGSMCSKNDYKLDNSGNIIVDSVDDLIYDKYLDINKRGKCKKNESDNYMNLMKDNKSHNLIQSINNSVGDIQFNSKSKLIRNTLRNVTFSEEENNQKRNSPISPNFSNNEVLSFSNDKFLISNKRYIDNKSKNLSRGKNQKKTFINIQKTDNEVKIILNYGEEIKNEKKKKTTGKKKKAKLTKKEKMLNNLDYSNTNRTRIIIKKQTNEKNTQEKRKNRNTQTSKKKHLDHLFKSDSKILNNKKINERYEQYNQFNSKSLLTESKDNNLTLKLKLNSEDISVDSILIEKDNFNIKRLHKETILFRPQIQNCYITKQIKSTKKFNRTMGNPKFFKHKQKFNMDDCVQKYMNKTNRVNKKRTISHKKKNNNNNNNFFHNQSLKKAISPIGKIKKKFFCDKIENKPQKNVQKDNNDNNINIIDKSKKSLLNINRNKLNNDRILFSDKLKKRIMSMKNKVNSRSSKTFLKNENIVENKKPILKINDFNKNVNSMDVDKKYINRNRSSHINYQMDENHKNIISSNKRSSCHGVNETTLNIKNKLLQNNFINNKGKNDIKIFKNNTPSNKNDCILCDICRKNQKNQMKFFNDNYNIFKDYFRTNRAKKGNEIKNFFSITSKVNNNINNTKTLIQNNNNLFELSKNKKEFDCDFPVINAYFHKED